MNIGRCVAAAAAVLTFGAGFAVTAPEAQALSARTVACARTSGNSAGACIYEIVHGYKYQVKLWDNACDGHRAYAEHRDGVGRSKFAPATRCGRSYTHTFYNDAPRMGVRVCIEDWGPNTCSKWSYGNT